MPAASVSIPAMLNIANLTPYWFARFAAGDKQTETRWRLKIDSRLEAVEPGEAILLLEIGSDRCISAVVRHVIRFDFPRGYSYRFRLCSIRLGRDGRRKVQGWLRRP